MKKNIIKLGTTGIDSATGLTGMLTHCVFHMGEDIHYLFQPNGINPANGRPIRRITIEGYRFSPAIQQEIEVPREILGSMATDDASGASGIVTALVMHINGCIHACIQPPGKLDTHEPFPEIDADLRQCSGEKIPVMDEKQKDESKLTRPSPMEHESFRRNFGEED